MSLASDRRALLAAHPEHLRNVRRGIEKEGLRVDVSGQLAQTAHPTRLGSALANPSITTDYSEALLELITTPHSNVSALISELTDIHAFVAQRITGETLWNQSMPPTLPDDAQIPVARYGHSNSGMLKHVYRLGLAWRYGKVMQCIAGVHYNFSLPDAAWDLLQDGKTARERRDAGYMALIRNFMRHAWLLMYLFGASPAVTRDFAQRIRPDHGLQRLSPDTFYLPWATSLRMSDLGYKSPVQSELELCYNDLDTFTGRIHTAVTTPWPPYEAIGTHRDGQRIQLNTSVLQIENEYYSPIRPKQTTARCERPNTTLRQRGIQYVEVRCMDIDPWSPVGLSPDTARFLDTFMLFCALEDSPLFPAPGFCQESQDNFSMVAREGRRPGLLLQRDSCLASLHEWALDALERMSAIADLLDTHSGDTHHAAALKRQCEKVRDPQCTPSARLLADLQAQSCEFETYTLHQSQAHWDALRQHAIEGARMQQLDQLAAASIQEQAALEAADDMSFEEYVARFHAALG